MSNARKIKLNKVKKKVKKYAEKLMKDGFEVEEVYIFGSYAKGNFRDESDIDVCIISPAFRKNWYKNERYLWHKTRFVDSKIEPIGYTKEEFNKGTILSEEIKTHGIKVI